MLLARFPWHNGDLRKTSRIARKNIQYSMTIKMRINIQKILPSPHNKIMVKRATASHAKTPSRSPLQPSGIISIPPVPEKFFIRIRSGILPTLSFSLIPQYKPDMIYNRKAADKIETDNRELIYNVRCCPRPNSQTASMVSITTNTDKINTGLV